MKLKINLNQPLFCISEYILRELKLVRTASGKENEQRSIFQYHYLAWKDFQAPENPSGLLKFIKHVNEAYSLEKGPILVHCRWDEYTVFILPG